MHNNPSIWDTAGAVLLALWAVAMWAAVAGLALLNRGRPRPWLFRACAGVVILGVLGQIGHIQEHFAQAGYWIAHPEAPGWMTPWGTGLADGFDQVDTSKPSLGMEILHLTGNFIFLAGLVGIMVLTRHTRGLRSRRWGRMGVWMQGIHGLEHVSLTLSVAFGASEAIGLSTWFGTLQPGPGLWTYRVWWHFLANVAGSVIFAIALVHLWRERATVRAVYEGQAAGAAVPRPASRARQTPPVPVPADPAPAPAPADPIATPATSGPVPASGGWPAAPRGPVPPSGAPHPAGTPAPAAPATASRRMR